jgi:hypothetical protein
MVLPKLAFLPIPADPLEHVPPVHHRSVAKGRYRAVLPQSPKLGTSGLSARVIDHVAKAPDDADVRKATEDVELLSKPRRITDVVGVRARHDRR